VDFLFIDDAYQRSPSRQGMGPLLAIGGLYVPEESVQGLETAIDTLCGNVGFPFGEIFKWSPGRELWMHSNLLDEDRKRFFCGLLEKAQEHGAKAIIVIEDTGYNTATGIPDHEVDLVQLFLERSHWQLTCRNCKGMVIASQPSGDRRNERRFLAECVNSLRTGTNYTQFVHIALNIICCPPQIIRLLQLADVITSCTTAMVSGETNFAPPIFEKIKLMLVQDNRRIGGVGLKIHPDFRYANLYHWLLGDSLFVRGNIGVGMPLPSYPYSTDENIP